MSESEYEVRCAKRDAWIADDVDPYPPRSERTHSCEEARNCFSDETTKAVSVTVAGRVRAIRGHGKTMFLTIEDASGRIQLNFRFDILGESYRIWKKRLDVGDFIETTGELFRTKTGEITVLAREVRLLCKSLEPLPAKWHGLSDVEIRFRRRYLDLLANRQVKEIFEIRARVIKTIRKFLDDRGFVEVETPMMQTLAGGAAARPFRTHHNTLDIDLFLRIAPELYLKRLLVGGFERVYELNRNFRNEGMDRNHNPEFTMLEVYEAYGDYETMMNLTEELIAFVVREIHGRETLPEQEGRPANVAPPWPRVPFLKAIRDGGGPDLDPADLDSVRKSAEERALECDLADPAACFDAFFDRYAEPYLVGPVFITDFPLVMSPLAKSRPGSPGIVERFEVFIGGMEIANAFTELNDPREQERRFLEQAQAKGTPGEIDWDYIRALRVGMPPAGGLGIGIDRLVMLVTGTRTIRDVILFPTMRPVQEDLRSEKDEVGE
ncbi:MAG: lysine--tRNA ligase [Candidatus Hydrogenedentota bacterium]|nr:MAG: lysine--tRNA ligase [Candidatus Hydrogenedentota bacterium]